VTKIVIIEVPLCPDPGINETLEPEILFATCMAELGMSASLDDEALSNNWLESVSGSPTVKGIAPLAPESAFTDWSTIELMVGGSLISGSVVKLVILV
jgi:hypothetical protein